MDFFLFQIWGGADGSYHTSWLERPPQHLQNFQICSSHFEIPCMALIYKMSRRLFLNSRLWLQRLNGQRGKNWNCAFGIFYAKYYFQIQLELIRLFLLGLRVTLWRLSWWKIIYYKHSNKKSFFVRYKKYFGKMPIT